MLKLLTIFLFLSCSLSAQYSDQTLADYYYNKKDYLTASQYYYRIENSNDYHSIDNLLHLSTCFNYLHSYSKAIEILDILLPLDSDYTVLYNRMVNERLLFDEIKKQKNAALKKITPLDSIKDRDVRLTAQHDREHGMNPTYNTATINLSSYQYGLCRDLYQLQKYGNSNGDKVLVESLIKKYCK